MLYIAGIITRADTDDKSSNDEHLVGASKLGETEQGTGDKHQGVADQKSFFGSKLLGKVDGEECTQHAA